MEIKRHRKHHKSISYHLMFDRLDYPGSGFCFDCDETGKLLKELTGAAQKNYDACLRGECVGEDGEVYRIGPGRVEEVVSRWVEPAVGICNECGAEVELIGFTNTCYRCETDYNSSGQQLCPRSQWGSETGEDVSDILSVDMMSTDDLLSGDY